MQLAPAIKKQQKPRARQQANQGINERLFFHFGDFGESPSARVQTRRMRFGVRGTVDPLLVAAGHVGYLCRDQKKNGHGKTNDRHRQKNITDSKIHRRVAQGDKVADLGASGEDITSPPR
jgi:hypothetical protein